MYRMMLLEMQRCDTGRKFSNLYQELAKLVCQRLAFIAIAKASRVTLDEISGRF